MSPSLVEEDDSLFDAVTMSTQTVVGSTSRAFSTSSASSKAYRTASETTFQARMNAQSRNLDEVTARLSAPPRLNPQCIRALLEQSFQVAQAKIENEVSDSLSDGSFWPIFDFLRLMTVCKSYLGCSQYFNIHRFQLICRIRMRYSVGYQFSGYKCNLCWFELSSGRYAEFINLLQPRAIAFCVHSFVSYEDLVKVSDVLSATQCQVLCGLGSSVNDLDVFRLVKKYAHRFSNFFCDANFLDIADTLPRMELRFCRVWALRSIGQLPQILCHKITKLELTIDQQEYIDSRMHVFKMIPTNTSLKSLSILFDSVAIVKAKKFLLFLPALCPLVRDFLIYVSPEDVEFDAFNESAIVNEVIKQYARTVELQKSLGTVKWSNCVIQSAVKLKLPTREQYTESQAKTLKRSLEIDGWKQQQFDLDHYGNLVRETHISFEQIDGNFTLRFTAFIFFEDDGEQDNTQSEVTPSFISTFPWLRTPQSVSNLTQLSSPNSTRSASTQSRSLD